MPNPLRLDPSRTTTLRRSFIADLAREFALVERAISQAVVTDDVFGLNPSENPLRLNMQRGEFRFLSDPNKLQAFMEWLQAEFEKGVLRPVGGIDGKPWTAKYIESAYKKAAVRSYSEINREALFDDKSFYEGGKARFLQDALASPEALSKIQLLALRSFEQLRGVTAAMSQGISRVLSDGLAHGRHPFEIARAMREEIEGLTSSRANAIARTEIMHAHAEGQLDAFERLGVEEVGLVAEWVTAGDEHVCPRCAAHAGMILSIKEAHGLIPLHPNCRCIWRAVLASLQKRRRAG